MKEAESARGRLELEARSSTERATRAEAERDAALHEVAMAKLELEGARQRSSADGVGGGPAPELIGCWGHRSDEGGV